MEKRPYKRKDKLIKDKRHDFYREQQKLPEPTVCPKCNALFVNGRWTWETSSEKPNQAQCPACRRSADNLPAGQIEIKGEFFKAHYDEILNLVRNTEEQEKTAHPLERIMSVTGNGEKTVVTTTGIHVARRIGEALSRSYKGEHNFQYGDGEQSIIVRWERN
ncbi:MAG: ATPase [Chlorobiales bacterium]|nr:ATPase [Chlorobiales bacterium]